MGATSGSAATPVATSTNFRTASSNNAITKSELRPEVIVRSDEETAGIKQRRALALKAMGLPAPNNPQPRTPLIKEPLQRPAGQKHLLIVKFRDALLARPGNNGELVISSDSPNPSLQQTIEEHGLTFSTSQTASSEEVAHLEARALSKTGVESADLEGMLVARPAQNDAAGVWAAAQAMQKLDAVEFVTLSSLDSPPPPPSVPLAYDIEPQSELLSSYQDYRTEAGVNMDNAWSTYGARGQGVRVTDCEYNLNALHEDLRGQVTLQPWITELYTDLGDKHGTSVLGILTAAENAYGMTGMLPESDVRFYPELAKINGVTQNRSATVTAAITASAPGDVVLLEMQTWGYGGTTNYVPAEYAMDVWLAVKTGTDAGVHVVAAAGNGGENLDSAEYTDYRNRGDSGAIIVGAGNRARARAYFSTYGSRVNVQAWGNFDVATLGGTDLRFYNNDHNQEYSSSFSGTSSASPMVTAAAAAVESITRVALGRPLAPTELRSLLINTGKPQTGNLSEHIGPLPDVVAALDQILAGFPQVSATTPAKGAPGDMITITGTGFTGAQWIKFDGVSSTDFIVVNNTTIQATIPANARTGRITVTTPQGTGVSPEPFSVIAGSDAATAATSTASLGNFTAETGSASAVQTFSLTADNLDASLIVTAPAGYEVSTNGSNFFASCILPAAARTDAATNHSGGWTNNSNAGLGFAPWKFTAVQETNCFALPFLGDPNLAEISSFGDSAFALRADPSNSPASITADRALTLPLKTGDSLQFQWAVNWDSGGTGSKGFTLYSGGAAASEILTIIQGDSPGRILFSRQGQSVDTGLEDGVHPMTWKFTRTDPNTLHVSSTPRNGGTNVVFSTNISIPGPPDTIRWFATSLDNGNPGDEYKSRPYFNNLAILPGIAEGGAVATNVISVRLTSSAPLGPVTGDITLSSAGTALKTVAVSGVVTPPALDYDTWAQSYGLDPLGDGAPDQNPDADEFNNLVEFFFGTNPTRATGSLVAFERGQGGITLRFYVLFNGTSYQIQARSDLSSGAWSDAGLVPTPSADQSGVPAGYLRMECAVPPASQAFYRIHAALP